MAISDRETAVIVLTILITDLALFLSVGKSMGAAQLKQTIDLIIDDFACKNLKPEDYRVCFDKMKKGEYGQLYDRLDGQIIISALHQYCNERADIIESHNLQAHNSSKSLLETKDPETVKKLSELFAPILKSVKAIDGADKKQKAFEQFYNEFEEANKKDPIGTDVKFINYKNQILNVTNYIEIRWAEHSSSPAHQAFPDNDGREIKK